MASHPPAQCCTVGVKHEGKPQGELLTVDGTESYLATPSSGPNHEGIAILFLTDVIGHRLQNAQLIADQFAANGYLTLIPDLFHGDAIPLGQRPPGFLLADWQAGKYSGKAHEIEQVEPVVTAAIKWLQQEKGIKKIGAVGYCFGAKYVVRALKQGGGVDVGYVAHPSFVTADELKAVDGPLSIAAAIEDPVFPQEKRIESEGILHKLGKPWQINLYGGVAHGFAVRGDLSDPAKKFAKEQAFLQAVQWFDTWLAA